MTTARPMACSSVRESATDASTAPQSIRYGADTPFPSATNAFSATRCSTNPRTSSTDPISKGAMAEADPSGSGSSTPSEGPGSVVQRRFSGGFGFVEHVVRVCKALSPSSVLGARRALQAFRVVSFSRFPARSWKDRFRSSLVRSAESTWNSKRRVP